MGRNRKRGPRRPHPSPPLSHHSSATRSKVCLACNFLQLVRFTKAAVDALERLPSFIQSSGEADGVSPLFARGRPGVPFVYSCIHCCRFCTSAAEIHSVSSVFLSQFVSCLLNQFFLLAFRTGSGSTFYSTRHGSRKCFSSTYFSRVDLLSNSKRQIVEYRSIIVLSILS